MKITDKQKCSMKFINFSKYEFSKVLKKVGKNEDNPKKKSKYKKKVDLEKFKKECEELGFKPKTEKFGECVLKLLDSNS